MFVSQNITFLERPTTSDELIIAEIIKSYLRAIRTKDLNLLLSLFHDDASIDSKAAAGIVSKEQYAVAMAKVLPLMGRPYFRDLLIRVQNGSTAVVYGFSRYMFRSRVESWRRRTWKLTKQDREWKISETLYHPS